MPNYGPKITTDGLLLALDAANPKSYPGTGTTWFDMSKNSNNGTLTNGPVYIAGESISFDGTNDYSSHGDNVSITGNFSIEIWFKGNPTQTSTYGCLVGKGDGSGFGNYGMYGDINNDYVRFGFVGSGQQEISNSSFNDIKSTSWSHYIGTFDFTFLRLYRNSSLMASSGTISTSPLPVSTNYLAVGARVYSSGGTSSNYVNFTPSIVRIYNKALTEAEIQQNFRATRGRYGI